MAHWRTFLDGEAHVGRYLPWREVARTTGLSRTTAWRLQKRDDFPAPYAISPGRVGYREDEVQAWCASRGHSPARAQRQPDARRAGTPEPAPADLNSGMLREAPGAGAPGAGPPPRTAPLRSPPQGLARRPPRRRSQHAQAIAQQMLFDF